jgi:uncharacterized protein
MHTQTYTLQGTTGTNRSLLSVHFGTPKAGQKVYIQASLHADEIPGMLVAHHLRKQLASLEAEGKIVGEIVLVPMANPIGLAQHVLHAHHGRFDLQSGHNFNRHYPAVAEAIADRVEPLLTDNAQQNVDVIRAAIRAAAAELSAGDEVTQLKRLLYQLACDADVVLDLHCDSEAVVHLYSGYDIWPQAEPLARFLGSEATLLSALSGDDPFDEACSRPWWELARRFGSQTPIPPACLAVTVELRGATDVSHATAERDAAAIIDFLTYRGVISGIAPALPELKAEPTPLEGSMPVISPVAGVVAFTRHPGDYVRTGETIAEVIDPLNATTVALKSETDGILYARENRRYATAGMRLAKVAGREPKRVGKLLSA